MPAAQPPGLRAGACDSHQRCAAAKERLVGVDLPCKLWMPAPHVPPTSHKWPCSGEGHP